MPHPPKVMIYFVSLFLIVISFNYFLDSIKILKSIRAEKKTISVSAEGKLSAVPDIASLTLSVIIEDKDPKKVESENSKKANGIIDFVKSLGVKSEDIKTSNYSLTPKYYYPYDYPRIPCPLESEVISPKPFLCPPKFSLIIGYELNQSISLKIRDFKIIGSVISGSIEAGANQISGVSFSIEDPDKLKNEAKKLAIESAKEKAKELAKSAGVRLGRVVSFSEGEIFSPQPRFLEAGTVGAFKSESAVLPQIEPGSEEVRATMSVIFEIK